MVNLNIVCPNCGKEGPKITKAPTQERIIAMIHSWICECGWVFSEKPFEVPDGFTEKTIEVDVVDEFTGETTKEQKIVPVPKFKTITPDRNISDYISDRVVQQATIEKTQKFSKTDFKDMDKARQIELLKAKRVLAFPELEDDRVALLVKLYGV